MKYNSLMNPRLKLIQDLKYIPVEAEVTLDRNILVLQVEKFCYNEEYSEDSIKLIF